VFSLGYIGSVIFINCNLAMIIFYDKLGSRRFLQPTKISFLMVGFWWGRMGRKSHLCIEAIQIHPPVKEEFDEKQKLTIGSLFSYWRYMESSERLVRTQTLGSAPHYLLLFSFNNSGCVKQFYVILASIYGK
jgi:hypothetical protein